jgi:hypothetical protein
MKNLILLAEILGAITAVITFLSLVITPIRDKLLGLNDVREGQKCLLRSEMLRIYYKHSETHTICQYEYESFIMLYEAYKALGGNSFIDKIYSEIQDWDIVN